VGGVCWWLHSHVCEQGGFAGSDVATFASEHSPGSGCAHRERLTFAFEVARAPLWSAVVTIVVVIELELDLAWLPVNT